MAMLVAACGTVVRPIATAQPTQTPPPATPRASSVPFVAMSYPADGEAPCGQAEATDANHAPYLGNFKRITSTDASTVTFELCRPDVAFLAKIAAPAFAINDASWLRAHIDPGKSGEQAIVTDVNGTGPYRLERWVRGSEIDLARSDTYWGAPARNERLVARWLGNPAERLSELRGATVDGIEGVDPAGVRAAVDDLSLQLEPRPGLNTFFLGFNNTSPPFNLEPVRRAVALGIDRRRIVEGFFPPGSEVASHYTPCAIPHGCAGDPWYDFDPLLAKDTLTAAGFPNGFDTKIRYREAATPYLPDPTGVAQELKAQLLANLGIRAELVSMPDEPFLADVHAGKLDGIHLFGQEVTYPDVTAFLDPRFGPGASNEFGKKVAAIGTELANGRATVVADEREAAYARANDAIRAHVPMIPVARAGSTAAFRADVDGAAASPLRVERFASMTPGDRRQLVWLTIAEPAGLYCADEPAAIAGLVCAQLSEGLYAYDPAGASTSPSLATSCEPNPKLTVWTCTLRSGVVFHDGATLDATDVVLSYAVQWDAAHPLHAGREGAFRHFVRWFGGHLNAPAASP